MNIRYRREVMGQRETRQERDDRWADELADQVAADVRDPANEYFFANPQNIVQATEAMSFPGETYSHKISLALIGGDDAAVGRIMKAMLIEYWEGQLTDVQSRSLDRMFGDPRAALNTLSIKK